MIKLKMVVVEVEAPRWVKRGVAAMMAGAVALGASAVVRADVNLTMFVSETELTAKQLNDNFGALKEAVEQLQLRPTISIGSTQFSLNGAYIGVTEPIAGTWSAEGLIGYAAGKRLCEKKFTSKTAHVCDSHEIAMSLQAGAISAATVSPGGAWFMGAPFTDTRADSTQVYNYECDGHSRSDYGPPAYNYATALAQVNGVPFASFAPCNNPLPILCCDSPSP